MAQYADMRQPDPATQSVPLEHATPAATGALLLLVSAFAFSTAGLFARSIDVDAATMLFWRNLLGGLMLFPFAIRPIRTRGHAGHARTLAVVAFSASGSVCYISAFKFTSVASVAIIYGAAPMITAVLARAVLRERLSHRTLAAIVAAFAGVLLTSLGDVSGRGALLGDGLALLMTLALSAVAVLSRGQALSPVPLSCASSLLVAVAMAPAHVRLALDVSEFLRLAAFGFVTMAVALPCYLMGLRSVPAGRAMLISALELPLSPLWVWAAYGERSTPAAALGGAIVCAAIVWDLAPRAR